MIIVLKFFYFMKCLKWIILFLILCLNMDNFMLYLFIVLWLLEFLKIEWKNVFLSCFFFYCFFYNEDVVIMWGIEVVLGLLIFFWRIFVIMLFVEVVGGRGVFEVNIFVFFFIFCFKCIFVCCFFLLFCVNFCLYIL